MSEYRVCVTSGYTSRESHEHGGFEAEALVDTFGGQVVARFVCLSGGPNPRETARRRAEAWIAASPELRSKMLAHEAINAHARGQWWRDHFRRTTT